MKQGKNYTLAFKRKREHKTDYKARLKLLSARTPRLVFRKTLNNVIIQIVNFEAQGDKTLASASSRELIEYGWKGHRGNLPSAYLSGLLCGLKAKKQGIKKMVLDLGLHKSIPGSSPFAALKGILDAGIEVPHNKEILPTEQAITGKNIGAYAALLMKEDKTKYEKQFSKTIKNGLQVQDLPKHFDEVKKKIIAKWQ